MLHIKPKTGCIYDCVSLGEVMLRLDPGEDRIRTARTFRVWEGGGEYNVSRGLSSCFRMNTAILSALAENEIGFLLEGLIRQGGVDSSLLRWVPYDGIGRSVRNSLNFTERGCGLRPARGVSDRGNSAASQLKPGDFDWDYLFGKLGVRWFHTGGVFAALSADAPALILEGMQAAHRYGAIISYDVNYRPSLWEQFGGQSAAVDVNRRLAEHIDVLFDFRAFLALEGSAFNTESFEKGLHTLRQSYPNIQIYATTERNVRSASRNDWGAVCDAGEGLLHSRTYENMEIFDRVGGGDGFVSGMIYGLLSGYTPQEALELGAAHGALAMTTPGDNSMVSKDDVFALVSGAGAGIKR